MRMLIVDDNDNKRLHIGQLMRDRLPVSGLELDFAIDYDEARDALSKNFFDLVILDLLLPSAGAAPSEETSRALIKSILAGHLLAPTHIIGLTAFAEVEHLERTYYDQNLFALEHYDPVDLSWADRIVNRINYLIRSRNASIKFQISKYDLDIFILAARYENEYLPIKSKLFSKADIESETHPIWSDQLTLGTIRLPNGRELKCGLGCVGEMGMAPTAAVAAQAISIFRPRLLAMLGMCCGFSVSECSSPRKLLDTIVVRQVACWEEGRYVKPIEGNDFQNRAQPRLVDDVIRKDIEQTIERSSERIMPRLLQISKQKAYSELCKHFSSNEIRSVPEVKFGTMVSGSSVIADETMVRRIISRHPTAISLDMEMYGLFTAVDRSIGKRPSVLGIKGVADFGHEQKDDTAQKAASSMATEVFKLLLPNIGLFSSNP